MKDVSSRKLVAFDVDDTLYDHKTKQLVPSAIEAVNELKAKGHVVVIATGRDMREAYNEDIMSKIDPDGVIGINGQLVYVKEKILHEFLFDKDFKKDIIEFCTNEKISISTAYSGEYFIDIENEFSSGMVNFLREVGGYDVKFRPLKEAIDVNVPVIYYNCDNETKEILLKRYPHLRTVVYAEGKGGELIPEGVSKSSGMEVLLKHFDLSWDDVIFFGDGSNDVELLKDAAIGFCVGGGAISAREAADYITAPIIEDGIYKALKEHKII